MTNPANMSITSASSDTAPAVGSIRFLLNGVDEIATSAPPDLTVLQWLRTRRRLTGTKEGCAEGDCGACTVVLGEVHGGALRWRPVNACILMLGQIHGKLLVTVEDLAQGGDLHPVQAAMVERHASQCGFCTPGFVMAIFAAFRAGERPDTSDIHDAIAGNLCRCTGYRPIVEAARDALALPREDRFTPLEPRIVAALQAIALGPDLACETGDGAFLAPRSRKALAQALAQRPDARLICGGTDLALTVTKGHQRLPALISLGSIPELRTIEVAADDVVAGAAASYADLLPALAHIDESLAVLLRRLGSRQIRSYGSIGGNLANASPIGDTPPVLLALGARVVLGSAGGERELALDDFFLGYRKTALEPGEYIDRIVIPRPRAGDLFRVDKISRRFDQDISVVCGAIHLRHEDGRIAQARIAFGGMAATPARARHAEDALRGGAISAETFAAAAEALALDFAPIDDFRASAAYRLRAAQNLFQRWRILASGAELEATP